MLIDLRGTYYHYCEIDNDTVSALLTAESMGRFYNLPLREIERARHTEC
jgi:hypothetical protein